MMIIGAARDIVVCECIDSILNLIMRILLSMENYIDAKNKCSLITQHWLETASPVEISAALEIGCTAISHGKVFATLTPPRGSASGNISGLTGDFSDIVDYGLDNRHRPQPAIRGQIGEDYVESVLKRHFAVENVSRSPKSGDLSVMLVGHKIVVEVKNYANSVPTIGVEKFRRDLCTTAASGGVFISLQSPIMRVTNDFTVLYEPVDERIIPCAYLVGNSENAIIVAVNMIISLIESHDYINSTIRECGTATTAAYDLVEKTGQLARVRQQMQIASAGFTDQITKSMSSIASAENGLREITAVLRDTTPLAAPTDILTVRAELEKLQAFTKLPAVLRGYIIAVMKHIGASGSAFANVTPASIAQSMLTTAPWLITTKKCTHVRTGVSIVLFAARADILIPRVCLTDKIIFRILYAENITASVDRSTVTIGITEISLDLITELLAPVCGEPREELGTESIAESRDATATNTRVPEKMDNPETQEIIESLKRILCADTPTTCSQESGQGEFASHPKQKIIPAAVPANDGLNISADESIGVILDEV
jgi:hypothetical protein